MKKLALLLAVVALLALAAGCRQSYPDVPQSAIPKDNTQEAVIYAPADDFVLDARVIEIPKSGNKFKHVIEGLLKADEDGWPKKAKLLGTKLDKEGHLRVNFDRRMLDRDVEDQAVEALAIGALVRTVAEFPEVKQVTIQIEGKTEGRIGDKRIEDWWGFGGLKHQPFRVSPDSESTAGE
jgi:hypothetical protein